MLEYLIALGLTLVIEVSIVTTIAPALLRRRAMVDAFLANLFTHPLGWLCVLYLGRPWGRVELAATLVEAAVFLWITRMPPTRAVLAAATANGVTAFLAFSWMFA